MGDIVRGAIAATVITAVSFGMAGVAAATPLNDPLRLCGYHDAAGNCMASWSGPSVDVHLVFPAKDPQEQAIVDYLTKATNDFNAGTSNGTLDHPKPPQSLAVTTKSFASGAPETGTQSTVLVVNLDMGGAYPNDGYKSFVWNEATKTPITFATLFAPGTQPLPVILPIVQDTISRQVGEPFTVDPAVGLDPKQYENFAITDDDVIFFFDKNELRQATGRLEVAVPRTAIADMLSPGL